MKIITTSRTLKVLFINAVVNFSLGTTELSEQAIAYHAIKVHCKQVQVVINR
jgi:hypothetical protein